MKKSSTKSKIESINGKMKKVYVKTPSRLHFCLIDMNGELSRVDGSLGISIEKPNVEIITWLSDETRIYGKESSRVTALAKLFLSNVKSNENISINIKSLIPSHVGFGSETQLNLAVASSIAKLLRLNLSTYELAKIMGRGGTSGIGVATFDKGGFILDGGHSFGNNYQKKDFLPSNASKAPPAKVLVRYDFPEDWIFILATPKIEKGMFGQKETDIFRTLCPIPADEVAAISRIILMKLLPSVLEKDIQIFGSGLTDLQNLGFAKAAKDLMHPVTARCIKTLLEKGAYGAGQSSFGPTAYGLFERDSEVERVILMLKNLLNKSGGGEVLRAGPNNWGAHISFH
jgi:beta-ribofuranosylaminobenzene 5'-phosphate synthase